MEIDLKTVGERVRFARENAGLTQAELGDRAGIAANSIARYERGDTAMSLVAAHKIAAALEVRLDWLCDGTGDPSII